MRRAESRRRQSTLSSRSPGRSIDRGRLPPLPAMESLSSLPRPPLLIAGSFRNEATPSELSPFTGLRSGPAYEDDSGSLLRRSLRRVNHSRSEIGISRPMPSYSESWNAPGDGDDGLQSDMNRIFEDLRSFNETLEAARESVSVFLYGRRTPGYGTEEDRSSGRAAVESRREPLNARQPPLTLFRGRSDSEGESEPLPNNGSISNGTRNTYNPFSTTRSTAPSPSSPDPLDLISSGDHDGSQSRFRLRAVSSRSFTDRRSNESGQASRLPPRLTPRTASRPHRDPLPPAFDDPDEIIIGLDEHPGDWFSPIGSPRTSLASARRPQSESLNGSAARRAGVSRPDPPVGPRSRLGRISPTYDYVPHTSWASSTAASESRSEENPRRLLAEEHMRPFVSSTSFSVPRPPWREGRWRESEDSTGSRPNLPSDSPLVDSSTGRPTLFRNSFGSSYRSTSETPYWRHDGESNIPPAHRRVVHTRLPAILPPLTRAASNRSLPSIATFAENDGNPRDELRFRDLPSALASGL
ncbi:hypothetical protein NEOLEDRAFT_712516 [Neolentinus lepideus HHB14362 ss-1]|uniref:Uncharacterized protein n=1 Tax=Neolentinus lepideus HHB14362 ss-1 TaxID=1314782 RepID=A0A165Q429_9AGAM|nr:hypothetical protein NEOLEDRAFT_712516 [Neolentinus lepideus HHB14362 ss-1]